MKRINLNRSFSAPFLTLKDADAIICALNLVVNIPANTQEQERLNFFNCNVVAQKLRTKNLSFTSNEWRVIYVGVGIALDLLSGVCNPDISLDELEPEWSTDLKRYFLAYNRLYPHLSQLVENIEKALFESPAPSSH